MNSLVCLNRGLHLDCSYVKLTSANIQINRNRKKAYPQITSQKKGDFAKRILAAVGKTFLQNFF